MGLSKSISHDGYMEPPCPEAVYPWILFSGGQQQETPLDALVLVGFLGVAIVRRRGRLLGSSDVLRPPLWTGLLGFYFIACCTHKVYMSFIETFGLIRQTQIHPWRLPSWVKRWLSRGGQL